MVRKIDIVLEDNPTTGDSFAIKIEIISEFVVNTKVVNFETVPVALNDVAIGSDIEETAENLFDHMTTALSFIPSIVVTQNIDGITITITADEVTSETINIDGDIEITHSDVGGSFYFENILSRSPYFVDISPTFDFDDAVLELKIYTGNYTDDIPATAQYTISKPAIQAGQESIVFDIHKIVNDFVKNGYNGLGITGSFTTSLLDSVWIEAVITANYLGSPIATVTRKYFAVDGFGYHTELANPPISNKILNSIDRHVVYKGINYPLYFKTADLASIMINGVSVPISFNTLISNQVIGYVNIRGYITDDEPFTAVFEYEDETITHYFTVATECKYDVCNIIFKNKFGFWQAIPFNKLSKKTIDIQSSDYIGIISNFGSYSLNRHNKTTYNVIGSEKITVNTDYITQNMNDIFTELMLSEFIYIEEEGENALPVNLVSNTFEKKTKLNNKLIQYSMQFEYSYNLMNQVI